MIEFLLCSTIGALVVALAGVTIVGGFWVINNLIRPTGNALAFIYLALSAWSILFLLAMGLRDIGQFVLRLVGV